MNLDPRKRFRESEYGKTWANAVATEWFQEGLEAALVTMSMNTGLADNAGTATAIACRAEGARQFIAVMLTLTDTAPERKEPAVPHNLTPTK